MYVTVIAEPQVIESSGYNLSGVKIVSPSDDELLKNSQRFIELRKNKGLSWVEARRALSKPITLASVLLRQGKVDGLSLVQFHQQRTF